MCVCACADDARAMRCVCPRLCSDSGRADALLLPGYDAAANAAAHADADAEAVSALAPRPAPLRAHAFVLSARSDYFRAALTYDSGRGASARGASASFTLAELCAEGTSALREWLYTGAVRTWRRRGQRNHCAAADASAAAAEVGVAARVAAAADARLLPVLASAARAHARALLRRLEDAAAAPDAVPAHALAAASAAADAASAAAAAGEWRLASAAVRAAAAGFAALRDAGALDALQPGLADALREAHVARQRRGGGDEDDACAGW
jgi:hypothetical protein